MLSHVFHSDDLPAADRLAAWHEVVARSLVPSRIEARRHGDFHASLRAGALGPARVSASSYSSLRSRRTTRMIRRSDPETYVVATSRRGRQVLDQAGRQATVGEGALVVLPSFRPFEAIVEVGDGTAETLMCQFPRALLPLPERAAERLFGRPLPGRDGVGALLVDFLARLDADADAYLPGDGARLGAVLLDLVAAVLGHHLEAEKHVPPESRRRALHLEVLAFIQRNLGDPELTPPVIAAAHHMSLRALHRLFQDQGRSVTSHIRHQRLEHARRDLADPGLADRPVHAIAARWGFTHHAAFTRAFHAAYGLPPRDYRRLAGRGGTPG
ncbi:helix-turn-helix domain-containing protein [Streptomyces sp. NPDC127098]|uniref:AraC-like ligand-binding domain-containing protein n=1 Tax=Streptomyces sp. NPDC127098 TaxID=3347137 RepID=UPI0036682069